MTIGLSFASFRGCGALLPTPAAGFACFADQLRAAPALANMNDMAASSVAAAVPVSALVRSFVLQTDGFLGADRDKKLNEVGQSALLVEGFSPK
jgi:hypothetical protein